MEQIVREIYVGLLGRQPESAGVAHFASRLESGEPISAIIDEVLKSEEFCSKFRPAGAANGAADTEPKGCLADEAIPVFSRFKAKSEPESGFIIDFMGNKTRTSVVSHLSANDGRVEDDYPIPGNFHGETLEWLGTLRSADEAKQRFVMIELGAGWAPWCAIGFRAAQRLGIKDISLIAVEGDEGHIGYARQHAIDNAIPSNAITIIHAVAGPKDGVAVFPRHLNSAQDYGGAASFGDEDRDLRYFQAMSGPNIASIDKIACVSVESLTRDYDVVDLLHVDIQGAEAKVIPASLDTINKKVRRIIIGTHTHGIDRLLINLFGKSGWICEGVTASQIRETAGIPVVTKDGCQVWRNTNLDRPRRSWFASTALGRRA